MYVFNTYLHVFFVHVYRQIFKYTHAFVQQHILNSLHMQLYKGICIFVNRTYIAAHIRLKYTCTFILCTRWTRTGSLFSDPEMNPINPNPEIRA